MNIAISGLGRMGGQIAQKLAESGHHVIAHNRSRAPIDEAVGYGAKPAYTKEEVLAAFGGEQVVLWIMIPADVVDADVGERSGDGAALRRRPAGRRRSRPRGWRTRPSPRPWRRGRSR